MKRNLLVPLSCLALVLASGAASAQEIRPVTGILQIGHHGISCGHDACPSPCKECIVKHDKIKIIRPVYGMKCKDFCLPKCVFNGFDFCKKPCGHGCETACPSPCPTPSCSSCAECGKVRTRRILLKKFVECEEDIVKCEVVEHPPVCVPACPPACPPACAPVIIPPGTEPIGPGKKVMPPATRITPAAPISVPAALAAPTAPVAVPVAIPPALPPAPELPLPRPVAFEPAP